MKTMKNIFLFFGVVSVLSFISCDSPIAFGERLDVEGPVVTIISPTPRKAVTEQFTIEGTVTDASGVSKLLIKVSENNVEKAKMWLYEGGTWKVSEDSGRSWASYGGGTWNGSNKSASWSIDIDMSISGVPLGDGEYMFIFQAWDKGGSSDANSFRTLMLIIDSNPPKVEIANPYLYFSNLNGNVFTNPDLQALHLLSGYDWRAPERIGKFQTQAFMLQWQIEDDHDLWSFDLKFYNYDVYIDNDPDTPLPGGNFYSYSQNLTPLPPEPDPLDFIRPNGAVNVPALESPAGDYGDRGIIHESLSGKTTIKVVAICYDAAGNISQEKTLGYFIYWPEADYPWIAYTQGMFPLSEYNDLEDIKERALMVYPGRPISANAFHYLGLKDITYTLWLYTQGEEGNYTLSEAGEEFTNITLSNTSRNGSYSTSFKWDFQPLPNSAVYVVRAVPRSLDDKEGEMYEAVFRVQDITFPRFIDPPQPPASDPLFMHLNEDDLSFTISGEVSDATEITSLCLVWINPESANFAAMSQLQYFRDQNYSGWVQADTLTAGNSFAEEDAAFKVGEQTYPYDWGNPNRLWKIKTTYMGEEMIINDEGEEESTRRQLYSYEVTIKLSDIKIGLDAHPLRSQVFLLKASNPDNRTTIITYAPQGDTNIPSIGIDKVEILRGVIVEDTFYPMGKGPSGDEFKMVPQFKQNDGIRIHGSWIEDSAEYLPPATYFFPNMEFSINGTAITSATGTIEYTPAGAGLSRTGTFTVTATVGTEASDTIQRSAMRDSLVVSVTARDFGSNSAEDGASWLVESDELRFMRISSEDPDRAYNAGETISIFFEFNKPVMLKQGGQAPALTLNSGGTATFRDGQSSENTRQYFDYIVQAGHNTPMDVGLNVIALNPNDNGYNDANYRFSWVHTASGQAPAEVRIVSQERDPLDGNWTFAILPTSGAQSLVTSKSIEVDTTPPTIQSITGTQGWHGAWAEIYININFSEPVTIGFGADTPHLVLNTGNTQEILRRTSTDTDDIRINNNTITFKYTVREGDNTPNSALQIEQTAANVINIGGVITDIPGTPFVRTNVSAADRTITGVYIDTTTPSAPTVQVQNPANSNAVISSNVNGTSVNANSNGQGQAPWTAGQSPGAANINDLVNVYLDSLRLNIAGGTDPDRDRYRIEYSTNYGTSWSVYSSNGATGTPINWPSTAPNGAYQITARQIDKAGNVSEWSRPVVFNWDKGPLVTSINSTSPNGVYTWNTQRQDSIPITVFFRKPLRFSNAPSILLNTNNGTERATNIGPATETFIANTPYDSLTFTYNVADGDSTAGQPLNVTSFVLNGNVRDADVVAVTDLFVLPPTASQLPAFKTITVQTNAITVTTDPAFTAGSVTPDNTYNTTLTVTFNQPLVRGSGEMSIIQTAASYRLPAVLTDTERNRYRTTIGETLFDSFYIRGTNGITEAGVADTSVKYILNYAVNPTQVTPSATAGNTPEYLAERFRQAEKITVTSTSNDVGINGNQLSVTLNGTNALRVPGGSYTVDIPVDFVRNELSRPSPQVTSNDLLADRNFTARPFIRVRKAQETITAINTDSSTTVPRIVATQPQTTTVKIDTRTPNSRIRYNAEQSMRDDTTGDNWFNDYANYYNNLNPFPAVPTVPTFNSTGETHNDSAVITIGNQNYEGYIWRILARAFNTTVGTASGSESSHEAAYRTVFTYQIQNMAYPGAGEQRLQVGDQIWLRGGDAIGSSSVPGYPLTWNDDWNDLQTNGKRAGIRLMTLDGTATVANSGGGNEPTNTQYITTATWRWVSWELNVNTVFDIILGRRVAEDANLAGETIDIIRQYGPRQWALQRSGWTSYKDRYYLVPGNHRRVVTNNPANQDGKGATNFSGTFSARPVPTTVTWMP